MCRVELLGRDTADLPDWALDLTPWQNMSQASVHTPQGNLLPDGHLAGSVLCMSEPEQGWTELDSYMIAACTAFSDESGPRGRAHIHAMTIATQDYEKALEKNMEIAEVETLKQLDECMMGLFGSVAVVMTFCHAW